MNKPLLSVVIPIKNERECLPKLIAQLPQNSRIEYWLVDGGSTDGSVDYIKEQTSLKLIQTKAGRAWQQNVGAAQAQADYLFFLHADSELSTRGWQLLLNAIAKQIPLACFRLTFDHSHCLFQIAAYGSRWQHLLFRGGDQGLLVTKRLFETVGGFDEKYRVCEDLDLLQKLLSKAPITIFKEALKTSSRKFTENGIIKTFSYFRLLHFMHYWGASPQTLNRFYQRLIS